MGVHNGGQYSGGVVCVCVGFVEILRGHYIDSQGLLSQPPPPTSSLLPLITPPMALRPWGYTQ